MRWILLCSVVVMPACVTRQPGAFSTLEFHADRLETAIRMVSRFSDIDLLYVTDLPGTVSGRFVGHSPEDALLQILRAADACLVRRGDIYIVLTTEQARKRGVLPVRQVPQTKRGHNTDRLHSGGFDDVPIRDILGHLSRDFTRRAASSNMATRVTYTASDCGVSPGDLLNALLWMGTPDGVHQERQSEAGRGRESGAAGSEGVSSEGVRLLLTVPHDP
jgi:hypothetical protein